MKRFFNKPKSVGHAPGSLAPVEREEQYPLEFTLLEYGADREVKESQPQDVKACFPFSKKDRVTWLNVSGSCAADVIGEIGVRLDIHPLVLEDILDTNQRPNMEDFDRYLFIELNAHLWNEEHSHLEIEQVSIILGSNYVITFQGQKEEVLEPVRKRIREGKGRITKQGADYLFYSLIDTIVDQYFVVLENLGEQIEFLEEDLVTNPDPITLHAIHELKRELILIRKSVWPLREVISGLERGESPLIEKFSRIYLRDIYDHTIQVIDTIETFRDIVSGMLDIYLSSISNRMNEIMKVLTIISTVFIPLSFIVGLYGMNFKYMPELEWKWGYFGVLGVILLVVVGMVVYFRRKKWL